MQYYTLIRPGELSNLKIGDISLRKQTIFVSKAFSKNRRDDNVGLNKIIIKLMLDLNIFQHTSDCYIFSHDFKPGKEHVGSDQFNKRWKVMRNALKWSDCYQFYSLKDSGIRDLASSEGVVVARDQARHRDISTTNRYIQHHDVQPGTLNFEGNMVYGKSKEKEDKEENKDKKSGEKKLKDK
jgi:integrase